MPERSLACADWQERLAGWLVAQVGPEDEALLAAHLVRCPSCAVEADSLLGVAAVSLGADPGVESWHPIGDEPPPADLADRIVARIASERGSRRLRRSWVAAACVAAAVALAIVLSRDASSPVDGAPVAFVRIPPGAEADATVAKDDDGSLIELTARGLDPDVTYALWLTPPGGGYPERVAAGTFRPDGEGDVDVRLRSALPAAEMGRVWATAPDGRIVLDTQRR